MYSPTHRLCSEGCVDGRNVSLFLESRLCGTISDGIYFAIGISEDRQSMSLILLTSWHSGTTQSSCGHFNRQGRIARTLKNCFLKLMKCEENQEGRGCSTVSTCALLNLLVKSILFSSLISCFSFNFTPSCFLLFLPPFF
jgi:hypothetical protein